MIEIQALYRIARLKPVSTESEQKNAEYINEMSEFVSILPDLNLCKSITLNPQSSIEVPSIDAQKQPNHMICDDIFANVNNGQKDERPYFMCRKQGEI